jgi:hypothetical protein
MKKKHFSLRLRVSAVIFRRKHPKKIAKMRDLFTFTAATNFFMKIRLFVPLFLLSTLCFAQKSITLEDIWSKNTFGAKGVPGFVFQNDGVHYTLLNENSIRQFDLRTGAETAILFQKDSVAGAIPD